MTGGQRGRIEALLRRGFGVRLTKGHGLRKRGPNLLIKHPVFTGAQRHATMIHYIGHIRSQGRSTRTMGLNPTPIVKAPILAFTMSFIGRPL